jgi:hypothetical protein
MGKHPINIPTHVFLAMKEWYIMEILGGGYSRNKYTALLST